MGRDAGSGARRAGTRGPGREGRDAGAAPDRDAGVRAPGPNEVERDIFIGIFKVGWGKLAAVAGAAAAAAAARVDVNQQ